MIDRTIYYHIKPLIPRRLQIAVRQQVVLWKRRVHTERWPIDEHAKTPPRNWQGWPGGKQFAFVLTHDVDTMKGQDRCYDVMRLEEQLGFRSSFNFVPLRYRVCPELRACLTGGGFEVGVHGLYHDGKYYASREVFRNRAILINHYLREWGAVGFRSPSMQRNLEWIHDLHIEYDASTFDTDPFEPQPDGAGTIFPFWVQQDEKSQKGYTELPYTLPQDFTLFVLMKERSIDIWKKKLDWIAEKGGMALLITHPDYMNCKNDTFETDGYPLSYFKKFLDYVKSRYEGCYWNALPMEVSRFWKENMVTGSRTEQCSEQ
ncbi:MAG: hypothetical protein AB1553_02515 [Nitrospirota bacterium]